MQPILALILCTVLVLYLLRQERKQAPDVSRAMWIPTLWIIYTMSKPLGQWFQRASTMEEGSSLDRTFLVVILWASLLVLSKRHFDWAGAVRDNRWLMWLFGYMFLSILWSSIPALSFKRWIRELVALTIALQISSEPDPLAAIKSILRRTIYVLIPFSLLLIKYFPELGREYNRWTGELTWIGVTGQKNHLGLLSVISAFFLIWVLRQRWKGLGIPVQRSQVYLEIFLLFLSVWLLGGPRRTLNYSATSTITLLIGLTTFAGLIWSKKKMKNLNRTALYAAIGLIIFYGTITPFLGKLSVFDISKLVGRDATLTGRTDNIWSILVPLAMNRPILGHGVGGFWTDAMRERTSASAHNGYLEILLHFGFLGLGLFVLYLLSGARKAAAVFSEDREWGSLFLCILIMLLVHNITESSLFTFTASLTAATMFLSVGSPKRITKA